ncbi:MAG: exodeoxyribonuclease small subunit [Candidatus Atribacteria bacterium]|nr:exodeoxyribonuclease small subunit [Candidatus Atribacteria bacterium]
MGKKRGARGPVEKPKNQELSYRQAMEELQTIVDELEKEEVEVDVLADKVKRAAFLCRFCKERLRAAEEEVQQILEAEEKENRSPLDS